MSSRKGQASDIITTILTLATFTMIVVIGLKVYQQFNDTHEMGDAAQDTLDDAIKIFSSWNIAGVIIVAGLFVMLILSAFRINTHPVFFIANVITFAVSLLVVPMISNMLTEFMDNDLLTSSSVNFPILAFLRDMYPTIAVVAGMVFFIALYAKYRGGGDTYGIA